MDINVDNYVDRAERVIKALGNKYKRISTSQIRNILEISQKIYDEAKRKTGDLDQDEISNIQILRTRLLYDSGREDKVKRFVREANLLTYIKEISRSKKREDLLLFCRYLESLVAYHRFDGGD